MKTHVIPDDRDAVEKDWAMGLVVATDRFMSGWGNAPGKSYVAMPFFSDEHLRQIENRFHLRPEFLRVRVVSRNYRPKLHNGDHLHIYADRSFSYSL